MGGSGSSGKGNGPSDKGLFDWMFNPVGSLVGKVFDIELDPIGSMAASQATNIWDTFKGDEIERPWFGDSWWGDIGAGITGEESRLERTSRVEKEEERSTNTANLIKRLSEEYQNSSLLTDDDEGGL